MISSINSCFQNVTRSFGNGFYFVFCVTFLVILSACDKNSQPSIGDSAQNSGGGATSRLELSDPDIESMNRFGKMLESSIASQDPNFLMQSMNLAAILETEFADFALRGEVLQGLTESAKTLKRDYLKSFFMGAPKYIRCGVREKKPTILFRFTFDGGFDYIELTLKHVNSTWIILDTHEHSSGDEFSVQLMHLLMESLKEKDSVFLARLIHEDLPKAEQLMTAWLLTEARHLIHHGEYAQAQDRLTKIPENHRKDPSVELTQTAIYSGLLDSAGTRENWNKAIEHFSRTYRQLPASQMLLYSRSLIESDFAQAHKCLDSLNKLINSDPFLDFQHSFLWNRQKDFTKAMKIATDFLQIEPTNPNAWLAIFQIGNDSGNFETAHKALTILTQRFHFDPGVWIQDPRYQDFFQSPQGSSWL